ncbi:MAG: ABC transporter ATP-binding protein [Lachnospiraceae bacterium]|nr:ABC transporter ATP-binding protein [Lachnospiraceae bacterium]
MENKLIRKGVIGRILKTIRQFYPVMMPVTIVCIIFSAVVSAVPTIFMQKVISVIEDNWESSDWNAVSRQITILVVILACFYVLSLLAGIIYNQMMAVITQGSLKKLRSRMFDRMQFLPVKYFDTNNHGDIMSHYTNDIDTLRQMISQSLPQLLVSGITVVALFGIMIYYCFWLTLVVLLGVAIMLLVTKKIGGGSARYFFCQQTALGRVEGFAEEMMNGQKVVKVFCHEEKSELDFRRLNEELYEESVRANRYANSLIPILNNIGNVLYVIVAVAGGVLMLAGVPNVSLSGLAVNISIVVPFLNMTKQFVGAINQVSNQINVVVMGMAGAERIFSLMDQEPEQDGGYVTLINACGESGRLAE